MKIKKLRVLYVVIAVTAMISSHTYANDTVYIGNEKIPAVTDANGKQYVSFRSLCENLGMQVLWDGDSNSANAIDTDYPILSVFRNKYIVKYEYLTADGEIKAGEHVFNETFQYEPIVVKINKNSYDVKVGLFEPLPQLRLYKRAEFLYSINENTNEFSYMNMDYKCNVVRDYQLDLEKIIDNLCLNDNKLLSIRIEE